MANTMTLDEQSFYRSQVELAEAQKESLKNQDKILREQVKISKEQTRFSKILMFATIILALAGFAQVIYYFEFFSQNMVKDFYDLLALTLLAGIFFTVAILFFKLVHNLKIKS